jgi:hypothetical protein
MKLWPFKPKAPPVAPVARALRPPKTPIPPGYFNEYEAIYMEAERMFRSARGPSGVVEAFAREIVTLQARLDKHGIGK